MQIVRKSRFGEHNFVQESSLLTLMEGVSSAIIAYEGPVDTSVGISLRFFLYVLRLNELIGVMYVVT